MAVKLDQLVLRAKLKALRNRKRFIAKWKDQPSALPSILETTLGKAAQSVSSGQQQPFNQFENPAMGGLSQEGRKVVSDRGASAGVTQEK